MKPKSFVHLISFGGVYILSGISNIDQQIRQAVQHLPDENYMLGRTLMQPFKPANSGSRALMNSVHVEHFMVLSDGEVPLIQTGYETEFGECSTSYVTSDADYEVVDKIQKFSFNNNHYFLILRNIHTGEYDVVERVSYKYNTESYGYMWDNSRLDAISIGDVIPAGKVVKTSKGYDQYGNKKNGVNLVTLYLASAQNMEDSVILSQSAAHKMETCLIKSTSITINDNDILLNLYGNMEGCYKAFPDIGERVENGIFCAIRRVENRDILFALSRQRQKDIMLSDRPILIDGWVCDIDVYCNNPSALGDSIYNCQLYKYYQEKMNFCKRVNDTIGPIAMNHKMSYALQKLYSICRDTVMGKEYFKEKQFNNVILKVVIMQELIMEPGDKAADRYGGKGVVSKILPDDMMPILDNGVRVDIIKNQSTCINRENIGQLHEQSMAFINMRIIDCMNEGLANKTMTYCDCFNLWYDYIHMINPEQADYALLYTHRDNEAECEHFITSILNDGIVISMQPFTTPINIDTIRAIYDRFDWIKPYTNVQMPIEDSMGNIRFVQARRPLIAGKIYNYRLKQYAEEKFSVTSLSATNLKNLNTRSKANKVFESKYTKTPIMFGFMESADMAHLGMQYVVMNLMLYSNSPQARRLFEGLLIGDPFDIDIQLDKDSKNRNAEIINALLKTLGLRLRFIKRPKQRHFLVKNILYKTVPNQEWDPSKHGIRDIIGYDDVLDLRYATAMQHKTSNPLYNILMTRGIDANGLPIYKTNINEILAAFDEGRIDISDIR